MRRLFGHQQLARGQKVFRPDSGIGADGGDVGLQGVDAGGGRVGLILGLGPEMIALGGGGGGLGGEIADRVLELQIAVEQGGAFGPRSFLVPAQGKPASRRCRLFPASTW